MIHRQLIFATTLLAISSGCGTTIENGKSRQVSEQFQNSTLDDRVTSLESRVKAIETDLQEINADLDEIEAHGREIDKKLDEITELIKRIPRPS